MANEERRPLKVFLCHASGDKPPVRDLYKQLTAEGVDAWLDQEKLLPGQDWRLEIPRAVQEADVVVVCLSKKSITKEGYVQKEIKFALDIAEEKPEGTIFLIPARLEDCIVPERLSRWQWVDLNEENGFIKLLRSLKLRANVVGAVIQPISDETSDTELQRRLDQLYTEGLAAFYTEDWDRACHRFQKILTEQPNHKNAAEKLAEAECQRKLAKLYSKSVEMYRSENWSVALSTLEELAQKSADYKDVAQLLRNARKQKRLKELYAEARALHAAQKWQAVLKVFEQILGIDPDYPDPEELLSSAQKEATEAKRMEELSNLYGQAVRQMASGQWVEARNLLEQVHKAQTGFLETERLLRKAEDEITKVEERNKRIEQVNVLYEQAHGLLRSKKWLKALDKIEEIEKLGNHFEDKDGIAQKAQAELEREEKEAQKQNQLAAMYAEAVRLLKEERYQEALDQWQEVKAVDSKYPDRQWVQRTAKGKLAETAKPIQIKPRFVITKSLWMGVGLIVIIGIVSVVLSSKNSPQILPTSISAPTANIIVNPPAATVLQKTNTPQPPMPVPTTSGNVDPTLYDDFENPANGNFSQLLWEPWQGSYASIVKRDGKLSFAVNGSNQFRMDVKKYKNILMTRPFFYEAQLFLDPETTSSGTHFFISMETADGGFICGLFSVSAERQDIKCWTGYLLGGASKDAALSLDGIVPGWHTIRFEVDPATMKVSYIIDGRKRDEYTTDHADKLRNSRFWFTIGMNNFGSEPRPTGYFDNVRIGAIEDDPDTLLYEDFNNPTYDGSYDKSKWETCDGSDPQGKVIQSNGVLSMAQGGTTTGIPLTNLCARKYENVKLSGIISFEAELMFPNLQIGQLRINLVANDIGFSGCIHHYFYTFNDYSTLLHCDYLSSATHWVSKVKDVKPGTWHSARIELDTSTGNLIYYLDGKQYDTYNAGSEFSGKNYRFVLTINAESQNAVGGYIDNVRISKVER